MQASKLNAEDGKLQQPPQPSLVDSRLTHKVHGSSGSILPAPLAFLANPASLAASWSALRDHNLRTGIPNLEQLLWGKGRPPLDIHSFSNYVDKEEPIGGVLLEFYKRVIQFENNCIDFEETYPLPPTDTLTPTDTKASTGPVSSGRSLIVHPLMSPEESAGVEELSSEAYQLILDFLDPGSVRFIGCPSEFVHRACTGLESPGQPWPSIFSSAKQYAFNALNQHFYQDFVDFCFKRNLCALSSQICLMIGSISLVTGLTIALSLILHNTPQYAIRIVMFPFILMGHIFLLSAYSRFFPFLGLMRSRESNFRKLEPLLEPLVQRAHRRRAIFHLIAGFGISFLVTILFCLIPGNHLLRDL